MLKTIYKLIKFLQKLDKKRKEQEELPVFKYRDEIIERINRNPVVIITGETGCGKVNIIKQFDRYLKTSSEIFQTTKVPQFILEEARSAYQSVNILVSQPRKIGAITIARRVATELNTTVGGLVGYQVGLDKKLNKMDSENEKTQILFCTTGVILQKLIKEQNMAKYTHIILDEIHERDIDTDFLMNIIKEFLLDGLSDTRLILMSATLDAEKFKKYFTLKIEEYTFVPPIIAMKIRRPYNIEIGYLDDLITPQEENDVIDYKQPIRIYVDMYKLIVKIIAENLDTSEKSILVFLPGVFEIECMYTMLMKDEELNKKIIVTILHSQLPFSEQRTSFLRSTIPKVILSTNIAESSVTLPDIGVVIDLCIAKNMVLDKDSTMASLKLHWISKQNCQQRAGRTGRTCDGKVYRMIHKRFYDDFILNETLPEILRAPLETTILRIKMFNRFGENPVTMMNKCMDSPDLDSVLNSMLILKELGGLHACDADGNFVYTDGDLTYIGRVMASLPIDVRLSKLIIMGYIFCVLEEAIIIAAGLNIKSIFQNRYHKKMEDYRIKLKLAKGTACDSLTLLNAYKLWLNKAHDGQFRDWKNEEKWCNENILIRKNLHEMRQLINEINNRLLELKFDNVGIAWSEHEKLFILKTCIAAAFYPNYFMLGESDTDMERDVYKSLIGRDPNRTVFFRKMKPQQIGEVYIDQIKRKLIEIGFIKNADGIKISFDSSKMFVELPDTAMIDEENGEKADDCVFPGKILPHIYEGVKMRNLNLFCATIQQPRFHKSDLVPTIMLKVMPYNQTREYAVTNNYATIKMDRVKLNRPIYNNIEYSVFPLYSQKEISGRVTHIDHMGNFFFQCKEDEENDWLEGIQWHLRKQFLEHAKVEKNKIVVLRHEGQYKRGKILKVHKDSTADCYFFDYGYTHKLEFKDIYKVNDDDINVSFGFPERGFHCKLSHLEPSFAKCPSGKWTKESIDCFKNWLNHEGKIQIYSYVNDLASVELIIEGRNINEYLIEKGFAVRCEEPYVSRLNYNERNKIQFSNYALTRKEEFEDKPNNMLPFEIKHPDERLCTEKIYLEGPFSPLEVQISGIVENLHRLAKVDQFSVNSVQLDTCVENYEGQLLIAADVIKNPPNEATLYGVTAMPNIRGLPALLTMMFAPNVVFEVDRNFKRILNVKSNVFYDGKEPIFSSRESTAPVNFKLDEKDCETINELRYTMSCLLRVQRTETIPDISIEEKRDLMLKAKNIMMEILQREREALNPQDNFKAFIARDDQIIRKVQLRAFAFNQIEFPKFLEL